MRFSSVGFTPVEHNPAATFRPLQMNSIGPQRRILTGGSSGSGSVQQGSPVGAGSGGGAGAPPPVVNPPKSVSAVAGDGQALITWGSLPRATSGYNVYVNGQQVATGVQSGYTASGLVDGTAYSIQVSGINPAGEGPLSAAVTVTPVAGTTMSTMGGGSTASANSSAGTAVKKVVNYPKGVTAVAGDGQALITFGSLPRATSYNLWMNVPGGTPQVIQDVTSGFMLTGLVDGTTYTIAVAGVNSAGSGPWSPQIQVTPIAGTVASSTSTGGGATSSGGSGGGGGVMNASGQVIDSVVVGYDSNGNPVNAEGQIVPGACGGLQASVVAGYDSNGNPVDCNGLPLPGANPCSGTVAGYDSNGNPVDCNGLSVPGAAACGGVMAGTDASGNPVDCNGLPVGAGASSQYTPGGALATAAAAQPAPGGAITTAAGLPGALGTPAKPVTGAGVWWLLGGIVAVGAGAWWLGKKAA